MKKAAAILIFTTWAASLWAFPEQPVVGGEAANPNKTILEREWLATTSYFFNQLRVISQTPVVPAFPSTDAETSAGKTLVQGRSTSFGFFHDLNYDGQLDEFLPLQLPPLLGVSLSPDRADSGKVASRIFSLTLPSFGTSQHSADYQLWLEALSVNQNVFFTDLGALARGRGGLVTSAQWRSGSSDLPEIGAPVENLTRVPKLQATWLAMLLGVGLIVWNRRTNG